MEVLFFGSFLPLHGADVIVKATNRFANEESIRFTLIGDGPEWENCHRLARDAGDDRIAWERRWMHYDELASRIAESDVCLGIFGTSAKTSRVIPCKVFNILAMGKPLITADTPAAREALVHGENAFLVPAGDPDALADAVRRLKNDPRIMKRLARGGLETYRRRFSMEAIGDELYKALEIRFGPFPHGQR